MFYNEMLFFKSKLSINYTELFWSETDYDHLMWILIVDCITASCPLPGGSCMGILLVGIFFNFNK